jgi:hypothetical protein
MSRFDKMIRKPDDCGCQFKTATDVLDFLEGRLRLRFEPGRNRLDMQDVIHLELKMPLRDARGRTTGDSAWKSISVTDLKEL